MSASIKSEITVMVKNAKKLYDKMLASGDFNTEPLTRAFAVLDKHEIGVPKSRVADRLPTAVPIYVFNICYKKYGRNSRDAEEQCYQLSGSFFPNHLEPQYSITEIHVPSRAPTTTQRGSRSVSYLEGSPKAFKMTPLRVGVEIPTYNSEAEPRRGLLPLRTKSKYR